VVKSSISVDAARTKDEDAKRTRADNPHAMGLFMISSTGIHFDHGHRTFSLHTHSADG